MQFFPVTANHENDGKTVRNCTKNEKSFRVHDHSLFIQVRMSARRDDFTR